MGELLQADLAALRALGASLTNTAGAIRGITVTATVTMPGSPVAAASEQGTTATTEAYNRIGADIDEMSAACTANAASYEEVDQAFRSRLQSYESGLAQ
ncbi:hypothetical protein GCM10027169_16880 [Gordonia jinhuaensis]|uniref:Excreted virulence factor EspC, type VII ESX diderm n=1 Tax=Gordonia jinhuaensis TaxID=1517702 RepID=A0A916X1I1_9ACTN|nr:hypothetical protein [Gordonia jinhuaensis]GGB47860.1 hypothetical protein GCM10011489_38820 [Gordonia jinhuaensis]